MTSQEFLSAAIAAAPATPEGLNELQSRIPPATEALKTARRKLAAVETDIELLSFNQGRIGTRITDIARELVGLRGQFADAAVKSLDDLKAGRAALRKVSEQRATLTDERSLLSEALQHLTVQSASLNVAKLAAAIDETSKSREWVVASGHADLMALYLALVPLLKQDPSVSLELGNGSKAGAYADKISELDMLLADLREQYRQAVKLAQLSQ